MGEILQSIDDAAFLLINGSLHTPALDSIFRIISDKDTYLLPFIIVGAMLLLRGSWETRLRVVAFGLAIAAADMIGISFKELIQRERPFYHFGVEGIVREIDGLGARGNSSSFPSNHALNSMTMGLFAWLWLRDRGAKWAVAVFLLPILVCFSRIYGGAHFPSDVLVGAALGAGIAVAVWRMHHCMPVVRLEEGRLAGVNPLASAIWLAVFITLLRICIVAQDYMGLAPEEAQYWEWSRSLDWSYYSKPPLVAWLIRATTTLLGHTEFGVRSGALVISILIMVVTWHLCMRLFHDRRIACLSVLWINVMPLFGVGAIVLTTDTPLMLFWSLATLFLAIALFETKQWAWYVAGLAIGFGLLSKYAMVYMPPIVFLFLLLSREHRYWLRRKEPYLAMLIALALFAPVIIWNWQYDWIGFRHVESLARGGKDNASFIRLDTVAAFVGGQIGIVTPLLFGSMAFGAWQRIHRDRLAMDRRVLFLLCLSVPIFLVFLVRSPFARTYANWIAMAYYTASIFAAWQLVHWHDRAGTQPARRRIVMLGVATGLLAVIMTGVAQFPVPIRAIMKAAESRGYAINPKMDPHYQLLAGPRIGNEVTRQAAHLPQYEAGRVFYFARRYQDAALGAFYTAGQPRFHNPNLGRRMNQYDLWPQVGPEYIGWDAIYVEDRIRPERSAPPAPVVEAFDRWWGPFFARVKVDDLIYHEYPIYRLEGYNGRRIGRDEPTTY
jgi:4-amino-4-deoxy-L-arabinose transferase-like glycosyltransferase/membrane-associated phospholipid phosphatase